MASVAFPQLAKKVTLSDGTTYGYIHVPAAPSKPTLLLLHGAPSSSYIWHHQVQLLPKAGFGVIVPDLLGYGDTDRPEDVERYRLRNICAQVYELVADVLKCDNVIGVGHDWLVLRGSIVLSHVYVQHRQLFSSLVFIAVGFMFIDREFDVAAVNSAARQAVGYPTSGYVELFRSPEGASLIEKNDRAFDSLMYAKDPEAWKWHFGAEGGLEKFLKSGEILPTADWISPEELEMHNRILKGGYNGVLNWYRASDQFGPTEEDRNLTPGEKKIHVPTVFMVTENDHAVLHELHIQATRLAASNAQVIRLGTGHWPMLEDKEVVERILENFAATI
ncbi:alpha/beta-hydrolase [Thozetella sp. PMI_491]|nr:alpha/beta-hydrolase [Thozetella sp. PMI_491]